MNRRQFLYKTSILLTSFSFFGCNSVNVDSMDLKIGYLPITDHLLIISKYFGANFTPVKFASWADLSEALRAQTIDGAFILIPLVFKLISTGLHIKVLMATHRNGSALVVRKSIDYSHNINALKGKKIAIPSRFSTHYLLLATLLAKESLTPSDINLIDMSPPEMVFALKAGNIDGFIVAEPFGFIAQELDLADVFILSKDIIDNHICCVLAFRQDIISTRRDEVQNIVIDFVNTADYIPYHLAESAEISQKFLGQKPTLISDLLSQDKRVVYQCLKLKKDDILHTLDSMERFGVGKFDISFDDIVDSSFIDYAIKMR